MSAGSAGRPAVANTAANSRMASRKLNSGPATMTIARLNTGLSWKVRPGSQAARISGVASSGPSKPCGLT